MAVSKRSIVSEILDAIKEANSLSENWSGGNWLSDYAAESLLAVHIARKVIKNIRYSNPNVYLTLEEPFATLPEYACANPKIGRPPHVLQGNNRADIVIWQSRKRLFGVIEVKRKWTMGACLYDLKRLQTLMDHYGLEQGGCLKFCCLAAFLHKGNDPEGKRLSEKYSEIRERINSFCHRKYRIKEQEPYRTLYPGNEKYSAGGIVIEFY
ncbi:MAG: hypothetical protein PHU44_06475 [Syntrophales bacterium]|nr:hypothetical protein [Syntrophales bacterium]MDD5641279.1 hypothetical protein [Syntrophales bacterium]